VVEPDRIKKLFDNLDGAIARLRILQPLPRQEFLADFTKSESAKHLLQVSIQSCLDVCYHLIASEGWRAPRSSADAFAVLNEQGVIPDGFLPIAQQMVRFHNRLVHLYLEVDDIQVYDILQTRLGDFERFISYIRAFISTEEEEGTEL